MHLDPADWWPLVWTAEEPPERKPGDIISADDFKYKGTGLLAKEIHEVQAQYLTYKLQEVDTPDLVQPGFVSQILIGLRSIEQDLTRMAKNG